MGIEIMTKRFSAKELTSLLDRAYDGAFVRRGEAPREDSGLSTEEIAALVFRLQQSHNWREQSRIMDIMAYACRRSPEAWTFALDPFLKGPDPFLAHNALWVLCWEWGLTSEYTEQLRQFIRVVPWDATYFSGVRGLALHIAAQYLSVNHSLHLLKEIVDLCEDTEADPLASSRAWNAFSEALGHPDVPEARLIELAKKRLKQEQSSINLS
jgi:hypothetical protein